MAPSREAIVQGQIVAALRTIGCWVGENTAGHRGRGHVRAALGDGATDLVVVDDGRVTFAEVKADERQDLSDAQKARHEEMRRVGRAYVVVWWTHKMAVADVMERRKQEAKGRP